MSIPEAYRSRNAYHFTSIENLESIINDGLLSTNLKRRRGITHVNVAEEGIQERRALMQVPGANGRTVHDYVPFYFAKKTPMQLAVLHKKNVDQQFVIYLSISLNVLDTRSGVYFTDSSANTNVPPNFYSGNEAFRLDGLDWGLIDSHRWSYNNETDRHRKMAELLLPDQVLLSEINQIITWNQSISNCVKQIFQNKGLDAPDVIEGDYQHYYTEPGNWNCSLVTGPFFLKRFFDQTVSEIVSSSRSGSKFQSLSAALQSVKQNFGSIQELQDIDGLGANYGPHSEDVGAHSRRVADLVRNSPEYHLLDEHHREILEISAYLHDIGKGPKSRWNNSFMDKPDSEHARKSLPMLKRILTEDFPVLPSDTVRKIVMLVTYDDLLGEIVAKGRNKSQLFDLVNCPEDIQMLVALSKSDIGALDQFWLQQTSGGIDFLKQEMLQKLQGLIA